MRKARHTELRGWLQKDVSLGMKTWLQTVEGYVKVMDFTDFVPLITMLLLAVGIAVAVRAWGTSPGPVKQPKKSAALTWLGTLAATSAALLVLQAVLGYLSGSLTLIADLGHTASDMVIYLAAYFAEKVKNELANRDFAPSLVSKVDKVAGASSTLIVAGVSIGAMIDAVQRLKSLRPDHQGESVHMIAPAILTFAVVSLLTNFVLLLFRFKYNGESTPANAATGPTAAGQQRQLTYHPNQYHFSLKGHRHHHQCPASPFARMPGRCTCGGGSSGKQQEQQEQGQQPQQPSAQMSSSEWLHAMFHPGCDGNHTGFTQAPLEASEEGVGVEQKPKSKNVNLFGATLHLATDVIRSLIVLVTGLLLEGGVLADVARTDAVCALVVGICVLTGSAAFFCT